MDKIKPYPWLTKGAVEFLEEDLGFGFKLFKDYKIELGIQRWSIYKKYYGHTFWGEVTVDNDYVIQYKKDVLDNLKNEINIKLNRFDKKWFKSAH